MPYRYHGKTLKELKNSLVSLKDNFLQLYFHFSFLNQFRHSWPVDDMIHGQLKSRKAALQRKKWKTELRFQTALKSTVSEEKRKDHHTKRKYTRHRTWDWQKWRSQQWIQLEWNGRQKIRKWYENFTTFRNRIGKLNPKRTSTTLGSGHINVFFH